MIHPITVPQVGESISEVTIGQWLKSDGEMVKADEVICEIESEKATIEIVAPNTGRLSVKVPEGETVAVGTEIGSVDDSAAGETAEKAESEPQKAPPVAEEKPPVEEKAPARQVKATPVAAKLMQEKGLSAESVSGSGPQGKITKSDVLKAAEKPPAPAEVAAPKAEAVSGGKKQVEAKAPEAPAKAKAGERVARRVKMSTLRKTIARRLVEAKNNTAMLTTFNEVDMGPIMEARKKYKDLFFEKHQIKLGFMSFFVKACATALLEVPEVNASIDGDEIVYHDYCDISIAVSTPQGLVVPVIFNAHQLTLAEIEKEVARLADRARNKKLTIEEMSGGTFSITNGGVFGSLLSTPIINPPQSAILGMHKIQERPMALNGEVVIRPMMYVSLSYDHRIIDGKESVTFLVRVKELLEDPLRLLLDV
ncbi:MAG: 2-oxoglutarate dehydrogenase complex dihydrolipoyllysine-residue succinyltransferase [Calditrichia bacterium]